MERDSQMMRDFTEKDWEALDVQDREEEKIAGESVSLGREAFYQFRKKKTAVLGVVLVLFILLFAIVGPFFTTHSYDEQTLVYVSMSPILKVYVINDNYYYVTSGSKVIAINQIIDRKTLISEGRPQIQLKYSLHIIKELNIEWIIQMIFFIQSCLNILRKPFPGAVWSSGNRVHNQKSHQHNGKQCHNHHRQSF